MKMFQHHGESMQRKKEKQQGPFFSLYEKNIYIGMYNFPSQ